MAVTFQTKTEGSITSSPSFTTTLPSGTTAGDLLVLMACTNSSSVGLSGSDTALWTWTTEVNAIDGVGYLVAWAIWPSGGAAPVITNANTTGVYVIYRYTATAARILLKHHIYGSADSTPVTSAQSGAEVVWVGFASTGVVTNIAISRGTAETTDLRNGVNHMTLSTTRESLGSDLVAASATLTATGTSSMAGATVVVRDSQAAWVMKGRDTASADTTGAA